MNSKKLVSTGSATTIKKVATHTLDIKANKSTRSIKASPSLKMKKAQIGRSMQIKKKDEEVGPPESPESFDRAFKKVYTKQLGLRTGKCSPSYEPKLR